MRPLTFYTAPWGFTRHECAMLAALHLTNFLLMNSTKFDQMPRSNCRSNQLHIQDINASLLAK
jgi:hypothetical protein